MGTSQSSVGPNGRSPLLPAGLMTAKQRLKRQIHRD